MTNRVDVAVIGGGPAGIAAATAASKMGVSVLLIDREQRLGGILKQCIHDGFGVLRYGEKLSGPEYAYRDTLALEETGAKVMLQSFVSKIQRMGTRFLITTVSKSGLFKIEASRIVLATGCRERTAKQVAIHGSRPSGVFTAGTAQYYTNILGQLPTKRCVILGSGDIGLIMARRLTLEGAEVLGVYESKSTPGGLLRNVLQCLNDFDIPLRLEHTVTRLIGSDRLKAVEICKVDGSLNPIKGTEKIVKCDALITSVGLIPENELAEMLGVEMSPKTSGPICDQNNMTMVDGVFSCGNCLHVSDLVDYVSLSGQTAGVGAATYTGKARTLINVDSSDDFLCVVPQRINISESTQEVEMFFRSAAMREKTQVAAYADGKEIFRKQYHHLRPPEMERIVISLSQESGQINNVTFRMERVE